MKAFKEGNMGHRPVSFLDMLAVVSAINSAGDTLTVEEARQVVVAHGGRPEWVEDPPAFVERFNRMLERWHEGKGTSCES